MKLYKILPALIVLIFPCCAHADQWYAFTLGDEYCTPSTDPYTVIENIRDNGQQPIVRKFSMNDGMSQVNVGIPSYSSVGDQITSYDYVIVFFLNNKADCTDMLVQDYKSHGMRVPTSGFQPNQHGGF